MKTSSNSRCGYRLLSSILLICFSVVGFATDVYITRDKNGNPVFSDQPSTGADKIVIPDIQTVAPSKTQPSLNADPRAKIKVIPKYTSISIISPKDDESVRENSGKLTVQLALAPEIRGNDQVELLIDGKPVARGQDLSITIDNVDRGTHSLQAQVSTGDGDVILRSDPITVHLLRIALPPARPGAGDNATPPGAFTPPPPSPPPGAAAP